MRQKNKPKTMNNAYKKHLNVMLPSLIPAAVIIIIVFIIWNGAFVSMIMPRYKELDSLRKSSYDRVVISSYDTEGFPKLKKLSNLVTFRNSNNARLNNNTYIQTDIPVLYETVLGTNEIAVSGKMADRLSLDIGSKISADYPMFDTSITYEVKAVLPYLSDLYDTQENQDFAFVIVGYEEELYTHSLGKIVYLLDEERYDEYIKKDYPYSERYNVNDEISIITKRIAFYYIFIIAVMFLAVVFVTMHIHKEIKNEVDKYWRDGFPASDVKAISRNDHIVFIGIPIMIEIIWSTIYQIRMGKLIPYLLLVTGIIFVFFIYLSVSGGRRYDRAN